MNLTGITLIKVDDSTVFKPFDCGDNDLNDGNKHQKKDEPLPDHVVKGIKRGQDQLKSGLGKTTQEIFRKYENL